MRVLRFVLSVVLTTVVANRVASVIGFGGYGLGLNRSTGAYRQTPRPNTDPMARRI